MKRLLHLLLAFGLSAGISVSAEGQPSDCAVTHKPFVEGGLAPGRMRVLNNGKSCELSFKFGGKFDPSDWKIERAPEHGRLEVQRSGVKYLPDPGYVGPDAFTVAVFGFNPFLGHGHEARNGRFAIDVEVLRAR